MFKQKPFKVDFLKNHFISFKDIIGFCHIKEPAYFIKCIMSKKYPQTIEQFEKEFSKSQQIIQKV